MHFKYEIFKISNAAHNIQCYLRCKLFWLNADTSGKAIILIQEVFSTHLKALFVTQLQLSLFFCNGGSLAHLW